VNTTFDTSVIKVRTPDGKMFVSVMEDINGRPFKIAIQIGKNGSAIRSWTESVSNLVSRLLENNVPLSAIINDLSSLSTDRVSFNADGIVRSGPDGVVYALFVYMRHKNVQSTNIPHFDPEFRRSR